MQKITAPEILWRIFTLVESNADLARASRLNKFIGAAVLDVLWNDIDFQCFVSLFPTQTRMVDVVRDSEWVREEHTNIVIPLLPSHWERANIYARRVKTLRRSPWINGMVQILTSLKLYDRGSETPCIFPKLRCLYWDHCSDIKELPLIANLFFSPTLQELSIRTSEYNDENITRPPSPSESFTVLPYETSLLVPLNVISKSDFSALKRLHLPSPAVSIESLRSYNDVVVNLLCHLSKWQLEEVSLALTRNILYILHTFPNLHSLELYDRDLPTSPLESRSWELSEDVPAFENLQSLNIQNLSSVTSLDHLKSFRCAPSHNMKVSLSTAVEGGDIEIIHHFCEITHLLQPRRNTLESLEVEGVMDLTIFLDWLFALPNLRKLHLGPGINLSIENDTLRLMNTKWRNLTHLSISLNGAGFVSLGGVASLNRCPIQSLRLPRLLVDQHEIEFLNRQIENSEILPLYSLENFYLDDFDGDFGFDVTEAVFVLAYLFPNAQFIRAPISRRVTPDSHIHEVLQTRAIVLKMLKRKHLTRLSQIMY